MTSKTSPFANPSTEADCNLVARIWREHGTERAVVSMFMVQWLIEPTRWEAAAMGARIRELAGYQQ